MGEMRGGRKVGRGFLLREGRGRGEGKLGAKEGAEFCAEEAAGGEDGEGEEEHGPDAEGGGDEAAFAHELEEFVDGFGDGEVFLLLGEDEGVGDFEHGEGEGEEAAGEEVGGEEGEGDAF